MMGCATSNLDDEEAVQICYDRKNFIKQAIEQRNKIVSGNAAYIHSLRRVSLALCNHVEGHHEFLHGSSTAPAKRFSLETILIPSHSNEVGRYQYEESISHMVNHSRASAISSFPVEEQPESSETVRIESHYPTGHHLGSDDIFSMDDPKCNSQFFSSPYNRPVYHPTSSQTPPWDFWDPFSSIDNYRKPLRSSSHGTHICKSDTDSLRKIRKDEGIPELEEDDDNDRKKNEFGNSRLNDQTLGIRLKPFRELVRTETRVNTEKRAEQGERQPSANGSKDTEEMHKRVNTEIKNDHEIVANKSSSQEPHDFTVHSNRRHTNMREVMKDMENQFSIVCDCVNDFSVMLELSRTSNSSNTVEDNILNPFNLLFPSYSSASRDDGHESSSSNLEVSNIISRSHKATLDRLYMWEKRLYQEVKSGERVRIAYERKCIQFRDQDVNGAEPSAVDKTRAAIRDLRTQLNVSVNSAEFVSKRIEVLRDQELHPQLLQLIRVLASMWRRITECHRIQKRTADEAKHLLFSSTAAAAAMPGGLPTPRAPRSATLLETELRNWASCLSSWIHAQRSYARALAGWIRRCAPPSGDVVASVAPSPLLTPSRSLGGPPPPLYGVCVRWSRLLDRVSEVAAVEGVEFFAAGVASVNETQRKEAAAPEQEAAGPVERSAAVGDKVVCDGLAVAIGAAAEFAASSAAGYEELVESLADEARRMAGRVRL